MLLYSTINQYRQQLTHTNSDHFIRDIDFIASCLVLSIAYNVGCLAHMLKGITNNPSSALTSLEGSMRDEMLSLLQLYIQLYPLTVGHNTEYLTGQLDSLIHRLVIILKEIMYFLVLFFT